MDVMYNNENGDLTIVFTPLDARRYAATMELVYEVEGEIGTCVPRFEEGFFKEFANSTEKVSITFGCEYLEFCVLFLDGVCEDMYESEEDTTVMEQLLDKVLPLCVDNSVVH